MVGIILATHGEFAEGILQSGSMIFGEQDNVKAVTLHPSDSPESLKERMLEAIATFDNQSEVLFLVDLWGGTPFNQANNLCGEHDNWTIVAGLNLPMLIEAYSSRFSMETAKEIATAIIEPSKEGVRTTVKIQEQTATNAKTANTIPEGTVIGEGKMKIVLARVDSRLLHGQVATAWTKSTNPNRIIVVSDSVAKDELRKKLIQEAAPPGVKANVVPIRKIIEVAHDPRFGNTKALLLFENPQDVLRTIDGGVDIDTLNIGSMAHSVGKVMVNKVLSMNADDVDTFEKLKAKNVKFDVRKVPNDSNSNMDELLQKAKEELAQQKN
ncbi:PTS mannose transporter subunit EIIAB [Gilliamella sp. Nev5-1]|jgi:mannose PTS system EIIAB component|uniref:mannose/fructose/sorbose PTS transporter subunit IIA n=1 Tax=unclassified Gilliamella TaxID=2685620 RepID=UPI00080E20E9|nr:mannose/fructose/sorbose PTS transporter subunit IIA [Gilliamella apicola]OCG59469.1 PTS mannose transporter subunit EIIAB [Gilliamella apicola]OCG66478.1 PTS mannose transporter subunit EIIAB [Gilliamella apicola]